MDADEIEQWYEDKKQELVDKYTQELSRSHDHETAEKHYTEHAAKIREKYYRMMEKNMRHEARMNKLRNKIRDVKSRFKEWRDDHTLK